MKFQNGVFRYFNSENELHCLINNWIIRSSHWNIYILQLFEQLCLFVCFWNKSDDCFWNISLSFTSVYDNKMTSFVELLTIALLFCSQWLDKTINVCFACICFYKFTQSVCYNWSKNVFKSTSIIRSSTLILYPCR